MEIRPDEPLHPLVKEWIQTETRRQFFRRGSNALGMAALASLGSNLYAAPPAAKQFPNTGRHGEKPLNPALPFLHLAPKAKHVIYLHMVGGPPQMDLYDYKPKMQDFYDKDLPESIRNGQRLTGMTSGQARFPVAPSKFAFKQCGKAGMWVSELLPYMQKMTDDVCFIRSMHTDAINHEPAITYMQTGNQVTGKACLGSWLSYGLGSLNNNLPTFVVLVATPSNQDQIQAISAKLWQAGYLPGEHAGCSFRSSGDPILFINNPAGVPAKVRRSTLDGLRAMNEMNYQTVGDEETHTRIAQYELAFRMQSSVPELTDLSKEPASTFALYGEDAKKPGTFANTALMSRRMVERGVRFVQIYLNNWDTHSNVAGRLPSQCKDIDQACYGLIQDLKARGMLDDTLVVWGGEFGRTIYSQGGLTKENYGRDHHPRCFTMWMAGGGSNGGHIHGETDDFSYNIVKDPVNVHDFHATLLHLLGIDHEQFTYKYQGLDQKLTGVEPSKIIKELMKA
jgi:hypothetical protein